MRQKTVYDTSEIAHLWMHKAQGNATNKQHNFYFEGDTIYSYGSHFPIARHVESAAGVPAVFFTTGSYSPTTSQHVSQVRQAIPHSVPTFHVQYPTLDNRKQADYFKDAVKDAEKTLSESKSKSQKALRFRKLQTAVSVQPKT